MASRLRSARTSPRTTKSSAFLVAFVIVTSCLGCPAEACECGRSIENRILKGQPVKDGQFPWMALMLSFKDNSIMICGATMISQQHALTAGHCIPKEEGFETYLFFGTDGFDKMAAKERQHRVEKFFSKEEKDEFGTDIAVAQLKDKIDVQPICLPPNDNNFEGVKATILGYGNTESDKAGDNLLAGEVTVYKNSECQEIQSANEFEICAGGFKGDPAFCGGDSGGPLIYQDPNKDNKWMIIGVIALLYGGCNNENNYGVSTRVSKYVPWIQEVTGNAGCQV